MVLMADGSQKPIEEIRVGDKVLATDPETGISASKEVGDTITASGVKDLVEIAVTDGNGGSGENSSTIATANHPFWEPTTQKWVNAASLFPGQRLRTSAGTWIQIASVTRWTTTQRVHNLTVDDFHTYHVTVGSTDVLVHNVNPCEVNWSSTSVRTFGHTFTRHGAGTKNTNDLRGRAASTEKPQGQWLDNEAAARLLRQYYTPGAGTTSVRIPSGMGQVIMPDGTIRQATHAVISRKPDGTFRSAYPRF